MGQYAHGNEPSHHMAYLYSYVGQPWKTQELTRRLLARDVRPDARGHHRQRGLRADVGLVRLLFSLGFYPGMSRLERIRADRAAVPEKPTVRLANGRTLTVTADKPRRSRLCRGA